MSGGLYRVDSQRRDRVRSRPRADERPRGVAVRRRRGSDVGRHVEGRLVPLLRGPLRDATRRPTACRARVCRSLRGASTTVCGLGTDGGLVRFKKPRVTVYTQRDGLASDFVGGIFQDVDGSVWAETGTRIDALRERRLQGPHREATVSRTVGSGWPQQRQSPPPGVHRTPAWLVGRTIASSRSTDVAGIPWDRVDRRPRGSLRHALARHPRRRADSRPRRPRDSPDDEGWPGGRFGVVALRRSSRKSLGRNPQKRRDANLERTD